MKQLQRLIIALTLLAGVCACSTAEAPAEETEPGTEQAEEQTEEKTEEHTQTAQFDFDTRPFCRVLVGISVKHCIYRGFLM